MDAKAIANAAYVLQRAETALKTTSEKAEATIKTAIEKATTAANTKVKAKVDAATAKVEAAKKQLAELTKTEQPAEQPAA